MSTVMRGLSSTLPPEVWSQVLGCLSRPQLPNMLSVCSMFHDIIIRTIFSAIKIYLIGGDLGPIMLNTGHIDWVEETARKLVSKSWEILNHICQEPRFAKVVKSLTIVAYGGRQSIFERSELLACSYFDFTQLTYWLLKSDYSKYFAFFAQSPSISMDWNWASYG